MLTVADIEISTALQGVVDENGGFKHTTSLKDAMLIAKVSDEAMIREDLNPKDGWNDIATFSFVGEDLIVECPNHAGLIHGLADLVFKATEFGDNADIVDAWMEAQQGR